MRAAATLLLLAGTAAFAAARREEPTSVRDDWPRALALARARDVPIVVDAWAPW
ncbi:MAG TPA: hypothetical protein VLU43_11720 [Anaeromyxobacteraceae bacterium]|nr:hypothetical protein [Anaeromyxobacteraceae bacterium]